MKSIAKLSPDLPYSHFLDLIPAVKNYQSENIYTQNFLRARNYNFDGKQSELIGRLCGVESALAARDSMTGFSGELLNAFRGERLYGSIDRVCLASRAGYTNELVVRDSANSSRISENIMTREYRCFVQPNSSLLNLREGEIRIYEDADRIRDSFTRDQKPVQRSMSYILKMGFRSGVCLPLHLRGTLVGFLFFNSTEAGVFNSLQDEDYATLSLLAAIAKLALISDVSPDLELERLWRESQAEFSSHLFDEDEFAKGLRQMSKLFTGETWSPTIVTEGETAFLFAPSSAAYLVLKTCMSFALEPCEFPDTIRVRNLDDQIVRIEIPLPASAADLSMDHVRRRVLGLEGNAQFLHYTIQPGVSHLTIEFPFDPVFRDRDDVRYSV